MRAICLLVGALVASITLVGSAIAVEPVDLLLVLASDVSRSIDTAKFKLQRDGYIAALSDPRVIEVIRSGPHGRIAICFVEWSGGEEQRVVIDWTLIDGTKAAQDLVNQLDEAPRSFANFTSISAGIDFAMAQLKRAPYHSVRQTIDVSGEGNSWRWHGRDLANLRSAIRASARQSTFPPSYSDRWHKSMFSPYPIAAGSTSWQTLSRGRSRSALRSAHFLWCGKEN